MEHILRNSLYTLLDQPSATLADVPRLLTDYGFRRVALDYVSSRSVTEFWTGEFTGYPDRLRAEAIAPILNKVGAFLANPILNKIVTQPHSDFDLRRIMDDGKVFLVQKTGSKWDGYLIPPGSR